jgi:hypothetical protein
MRDRFEESVTGLGERVGVEDQPDQGGQQSVLVLAGVPEAVSEEVNGAALPAAAQDLGDRRLRPGMGVRDGQLDADQPAGDQALRKSVQNASVSASPTSIERISWRPVS